jgi:hypothetical protein
MASTHYNPDVAPDAQDWLALSEAQRIRLVQSYHVSARVKVPNMKTHAAMHAAVENQIATGYGPSKRAIARLQSEGLSRHEAIHAIASIVAQFIYELSKGQTAEEKASFQSRLNESIEGLHAEQWFSSEDDASGG